jgi:hypothetical protein
MGDQPIARPLPDTGQHKQNKRTQTFMTPVEFGHMLSGRKQFMPGSIPVATRFSEKCWVWNGVHSAS